MMATSWSWSWVKGWGWAEGGADPGGGGGAHLPPTTTPSSLQPEIGSVCACTLQTQPPTSQPLTTINTINTIKPLPPAPVCGSEPLTLHQEEWLAVQQAVLELLAPQLDVSAHAAPPQASLVQASQAAPPFQSTSFQSTPLPHLMRPPPVFSQPRCGVHHAWSVMMAAVHSMAEGRLGKVEGREERGWGAKAGGCSHCHTVQDGWHLCTRWV